MKSFKLLIAAITILAGSLQLYSQSDLFNTAQYKMSLIYVLEDGTNASAVAYDPSENVYYAVIAGNESFPLEKFDASGNSLYTSNAGVDTRGLWWNSKSKSLEINAYGDNGYYRVDLDGYGNLSGFAIQLVTGMNQPGEQSVAAFDDKKQLLYFFLDGAIYSYSVKNGKESKKHIYLDIPVSLDDINYTTVIYTGVKGKEFGLLNYVDGDILFFDKKGKNTGSVNLPDDAPVNSYFRFSYANGLVWLYSTDYRTWYGYKIFR
jgi:hypothetical protein